VGIGPTVIAAALMIGIGPALLPFATRGSAVPILIAYGVIATFGGGLYNINVRSLAQTITPDRMLGRLVATFRFLVWGTIPVGGFLGGLLGGIIGLRPTLVLAGAGGLLAFIPPMLSPVRTLLTIPDHAGADVEPEVAMPTPTGFIEPAIDPE
jgi:hypothetical protein